MTYIHFDFYIYQLDNGTWSAEMPIATPINLAGLSEGAHNLYVLTRATGDFYPVDSEATVYSWTVDQTAPTTTISNLSGLPPNDTTSTSVSITVGTASGATNYRYSIDGGAYGSATSTTTPISLSGLALGSHTINIITGDAAGNWQPTSAATSYTWTISQATPPTSGGGGGGGGCYSCGYGAPTIAPKVLGAKTQLFKKDTVLKVKGKSQYYLIKKDGSRKALTLKGLRYLLSDYRKRFGKRKKIITAEWAIIKSIPIYKVLTPIK